MAASARALTPSHTAPFATPSSTLNSPTTVPSSATESAAGAVAAASLSPNIGPTLRSSLSPKSPRRGLSPGLSPNPLLTGAAALADERRMREQRPKDQAHQMSPNPATSAINALLGNDVAQSAIKDGPPTTQISEPLAKVAKSIQIPENATSDALQTSPVSISSFGSLENSTAPTVTASDTATAGPVRSATANTQHSAQSEADVQAPNETHASRAFTFPGPLNAAQDPRAPQRVMSLPNYGQNSPKSPSTKRHKCPYCSTDFTRHHNLKSHLLTHSQEKPFECTECHSRFRRLHDLKRHSKLHTGERPHICPKCGRKFARGDALARHNKGQGGCAGRRSSFSGIDEDPGDRADDSMDGLEYHGEQGDDKMDEDDGEDGARRGSITSGRHDVRQAPSQSGYAQHSSTYPPISNQLMGPGARSLYPPSAAHSNSSREQISPKAGSSLSSAHFNSSNGGVYAHGGMTESPKPLSPGQTDSHSRISGEGSVPGPRSPNMSQHSHPTFNRGTGSGSGPRSLPPPSGNMNAPQLPQLPGLGPTDPRLPGVSQSHSNKIGNLPGPGGVPNMLHQSGSSQPSQSNPGSLSSHGQSSGGSLREIIGNRDTDIWAYLRDLESRTQKSSEEYEARIARLEEEINSLKSQLQQAQPQQSRQQQAGR